MAGRSRVTACLFGDGAVAEGEFHETLNLAALWRLPVLFLCENNLYAMGTRIERAQAQTDPCRKAEALGVPASSVDGMDVFACEEACRRSAGRVRQGAGPLFVEFKTYRYRAHSMFDPELYRDRAEVEQWRARDPVAAVRGAVAAADGGDAALRQVEAAVEAEIAAAVACAEAGTWEPVEHLTRDVYTPASAGGPATGQPEGACST
jgi:pyruvate dehydrogenase E1 component alpha subunit